MKTYTKLSDIQSDLKNNHIKLPELVNQYLQNIENTKEYNIYLEVFDEEAKNKATEVQQKIENGTAGKLAGMVIAIKDNICYKNHKVSASSKILENFESLFSATAVERLIKEDAIIIGRTNCDEFAMGSSNENSYYGAVKNPLNPDYVPGGSSGGSAAAVAANTCLAALGSDTGGSIRQPASFCGVVGLKPTYGRVSRYGLIAYASSFDQIGPITMSVEDAALIMQIISGADNYDTTSSSKPVDNYTESLNTKKKYKITYFKSYLEKQGLDPEIKSHIEETIEKLKSEGHTVEPTEFPYLDYVVPTYYVLTTAEASSNLARYDGIHFGYRSPNAHDLESTYVLSRTEGFGEEVKRRIMLGTYVLSAGYYDAYYAKGQKVRRILKEQTDKILSEFDFILMPTTPGTAFKIGEQIDDPIKMYLEDIYTVQANLTGVPAISLPTGKHSNKLPFGIQIMTKHFNEKELFAFANNFNINE
jgi:aspartyl-tRNA(Asn)/glutamyl-tRNA(Gln) amidotransferase subunit A